MQWVATYKGQEPPLRSYEGGRYQDIDRSKLECFTLLADNGVPVITLFLDPGQRLIYRRRVFTTGSSDKVYYMVGWQQTVGGRNVQAIAYVSDDGKISLAGQFRENHPVFYSIQAYPEEL